MYLSHLSFRCTANGRTVSFRACKPWLICRSYLTGIPYTASLVNVAINMHYKNAKNIKFIITRFVFSSLKCTEIHFRPGFAPDPAGWAYNSPPDPLSAVEGDRDTHSAPPRHLCLILSHMVRRSAPLTQIPGYVSGKVSVINIRARLPYRNTACINKCAAYLVNTGVVLIW